MAAFGPTLDHVGFHRRMCRLRMSEIGTDGIICAMGGDVPIHLCFICGCNELLNNRITTLLKDGGSELFFMETPVAGVEALVNYCYSGLLSPTRQNYGDVIDAAFAMEFLEVVQECVNYATKLEENTDVWCQFLIAAFKYPGEERPDDFIPNRILRNLNSIPLEAMVRTLDATNLVDILKYGALPGESKVTTLAIFINVLLQKNASLDAFSEVLDEMKIITSASEAIVLPNDLPEYQMLSLVEVGLKLDFPGLVKAGVTGLLNRKRYPHVLSKLLAWIRENDTVSGRCLRKYIREVFPSMNKGLQEEELTYIMRSDWIENIQEFRLFHIAHEWVQHNKVEDVDARRKIYRLLRFGLMSRSDCDRLIADYPEVVEVCGTMIVHSLRYHLRVKEKPLCDLNLNRMRTAWPRIYIMGGMNKAKVVQDAVYSCQVKDGVLGEFHKMSPLPKPIMGAAAVVVNDFIFVVGGLIDGKKGDTLWRYDPRADSWLTLTCMKNRRSWLSVSAVAGGFLAMGGWHFGDIRSVERYSIRKDEWETVPDLPHSSRLHASCVVENRIYVSGGSQERSLVAFDGTEWIYLRGMNQGRQAHSMVAVGRMLMVAGGASAKDDIGNGWNYLTSTECYDIDANQWSRLPQCPRNFFYSLPVHVEEAVYFLGGNNGRGVVDTIHQYDINSDEWGTTSVSLPLCLGSTFGGCIGLDRNNLTGDTPGLHPGVQAVEVYQREGSLVKSRGVGSATLPGSLAPWISGGNLGVGVRDARRSWDGIMSVAPPGGTHRGGVRRGLTRGLRVSAWSQALEVYMREQQSRNAPAPPYVGASVDF